MPEDDTVAARGDPLGWQELAKFWQRLVMLPANDFDEIARRVADGLNDLTGAQRTTLALATRSEAEDDPLFGWRLRQVLLADDVAPPDKEIYSSFKNSRPFVDDPHPRAMAAGAGAHRVLLRYEAVTREEWDGSSSEAFYDSLGVVDHIVGVLPLTPGVEFYCVSSRLIGEPPFGESERDMLFEALGGLHAPARRLALSFGLGGGKDALRPRERQTLQGLLRGLSEKEVARELGIAPRTAHEYVVAVYRKLGVRSRGELLALWLEGP